MPARGLTWSRPANIVGSLRIAVPWIQATGPGAAAAADSLPMTIAIAPSELGQTSSSRSGAQSSIDSWTVLRSMSGRCSWAFGFRSALSRSLTDTRWPM